MKKLLFGLLFFFSCNLMATNEEPVFFSLKMNTTIMAGSGSGVGAVSATELSAWDVLYKTVNKDTLAERFNRNVHRFYVKRKGLSIGWKFTEFAQLDAIAAQNLPVTPAASELAAWDNLYRNVSTQNLRWLIRLKSHKKYLRDKGWSAIFTKSEENYIEIIKELLAEEE